MDKKGLLLLMILTLSILLFTSIGFAGEQGLKQYKKRDSHGVKHACGLKQAADGIIGIDKDAQMKLGPVEYVHKKEVQEEVLRKEEASTQVEAMTNANAAAVLAQGTSSADSSQAINPAEPDAQSEQARAEQMLASIIAQNPIVQGTTVYVRECPHNWQGCTYYKTAVIWIDPDHTAPLEKIMVHECNHIVDWRSDGRIDNNDYHE